MIEDFKKTAKDAGKNMSNFDWCFQMRLSIGATDDVARNNCDWIPQQQTSMGRYAGYMWNVKENWREAKGAISSTRPAKSFLVRDSFVAPDVVPKF